MLGGFDEVVAHDDVEVSLRLLGEAGVPVVTLTNGSVGITRALLERERLADHVAATYDVTLAGRWKPAPAAYTWVLDRHDVTARDAALVAVHPWDIHGAAQVGLATGWVNRTGQRYPDVFTTPSVTGTSMDAVVQSLLGPRDGN